MDAVRMSGVSGPLPSDADLVARTLAGEKDAFGALADRYGKLVSVLAFQKVGNRADAEDLAQDAFLKAYHALADLKEPEKFGSWLYNIAFRLAIDLLRRRGRTSAGVEALKERALGAAPPPSLAGAVAGGGQAEDASRREWAEKVMEAVGSLPDKYRLVLTLRYQRMMSYRAIAEHLGEPGGTIGNRLHRAANMLRERLRALAVEI